jgi:hypothetical protein
MAPHMPAVVGWDIAREGRHWIGVREEPLTERQKAFGCVQTLEADSHSALLLDIATEAGKREITDCTGRLVDRLVALMEELGRELAGEAR